MNLVERAKNIIVTPKTEWNVIDAESGSIADIYKSYLIIIAAIPAIASFIGISVIGMSLMGTAYRLPIGAGLASMIVSYVLSLAMAYVLSLIVNALAPTFQAQASPLNAFKLVAYSMTPGCVAGVLQIVPLLGIIVLLASIYGLYVMYQGLPVLMKVPEDKLVPYFVVIIVCAVVLWLVIGALGNMVTGPAMTGMAPRAY